jgi:hypothetical protein
MVPRHTQRELQCRWLATCFPNNSSPGLVISFGRLAHLTCPHVTIFVGLSRIKGLHKPRNIQELKDSIRLKSLMGRKTCWEEQCRISKRGCEIEYRRKGVTWWTLFFGGNSEIVNINCNILVLFPCNKVLSNLKIYWLIVIWKICVSSVAPSIWNIRINPRKLRCAHVKLIKLAPKRHRWRLFVNTVTNFQLFWKQ